MDNSKWCTLSDFRMKMKNMFLAEKIGNKKSMMSMMTNLLEKNKTAGIYAPRL